MQVIILLGPPGSGKGTLAQMCLQNNFAVIGAGDLLRERALGQDLVALKLGELLSNGQMVDNDLILGIVIDKLNYYRSFNSVNGILLDGYPRNLAQMKSLYDYLKTFGNDFLQNLRVFYITASDDLLYERIFNRFICSNPKCSKINNNIPKCLYCGSDVIRRSDDLSVETIATRLSIFKSSVEPLIEFLNYNEIPVHTVHVSKLTTKDQLFDSFSNYVSSET